MLVISHALVYATSARDYGEALAVFELHASWFTIGEMLETGRRRLV